VARSGRPTTLPATEEDSFVQRIQNRAIESDQVSVLKGQYIKAILENEFKVSYSVSGVYSMLKRLNFKKVKPRPQHEKNDEEAMAKWKTEILPEAVFAAKIKYPGKQIEVWFQDETRFGNKTKISSEWQLEGTSWRLPKQYGFRNSYIYGAVNPIDGSHIGFVFSECNTDGMNIHLDLISQSLQGNKHAILVMDQAGWHSNAKNLAVPENITIVDLPPYSPELNPMENLWLWIKENFFANKFIDKDDDLLEIGCEMWNYATSDIIKSVCAVRFLESQDFL